MLQDCLTSLQCPRLHQTIAVMCQAAEQSRKDFISFFLQNQPQNMKNMSQVSWKLAEPEGYCTPPCAAFKQQPTVLLVEFLGKWLILNLIVTAASSQVPGGCMLHLIRMFKSTQSQSPTPPLPVTTHSLPPEKLIRRNKLLYGFILIMKPWSWNLIPSLTQLNPPGL